MYLKIEREREKQIEKEGDRDSVWERETDRETKRKRERNREREREREREKKKIEIGGKKEIIKERENWNKIRWMNVDLWLNYLLKRDSKTRGTLRSIRIPRLDKISFLYRDWLVSLK